MNRQAFDSALEQGNAKFEWPHEPQLLQKLLEKIESVRDLPKQEGRERTQFILQESIREALNQMELEGDIRERYKWMAFAYYRELNKLGFRNGNEQIPFTGVVEAPRMDMPQGRFVV